MPRFYLIRTSFPRRMRRLGAVIADALVAFLTCGFFGSSFQLDNAAAEARRAIEKCEREYDAQQNSRKPA